MTLVYDVVYSLFFQVGPEINADEGMLMNHLRQSVRKSNYSVGGTALLTSPSYMDSFYAEGTFTLRINIYFHTDNDNFGCV